MNKTYTYIDDKVLISDENNNLSQIEYYDNLDKVLIQENLIESMTSKIQKLKKQKESLKNNNHKHYIPIALPISITSSVIGPIILNLLTYTNAFTTSLNSIFNISTTAIIFSNILLMTSIPIATVIDFVLYQIHKESIRKEKGISSELNFLKKNIEKEKDILEI